MGTILFLYQEPEMPEWAYPHQRLDKYFRMGKGKEKKDEWRKSV